jgi:predicted phage terminase large subunit-like protein
LKAERARRHLKTFIETAWSVVEPAAEFVPNWHIDCLAEHLTAVSAGQIKKLLVCIPPRHGKSLICSVLWPAWEWTSKPWLRWLHASYAESLSIRDSLKVRRLITSAWYSQHWGNLVAPSPDQNEKRSLELQSGGHRLSLGAGSAITGQGGDRLVVDDAHHVSEAQSDTIREAVIEWHDTVWSSRANDPKTTARVVVGQRVHARDLIAHLIEQGGWELLSLPAEYAGDTRKTVIGWSDPRREVGELLWPQRFGQAEIEDSKRMLGSYAYSAQFLQQPAPAGGGLLKKSWFRFYTEQPADLTGHMLSIDCSFKETQTSDFVVVQVWGRRGADKFLLDQYRKRADFVATVAAVRAMSQRWPQACRKLIENKANGEAVISSLKHEIAGIVPFNPRESKEARVSAIAPQVEAGNVYLPHPSIAPWIDEFLHEASSFPVGAHDDVVDAMSQALAVMADLIPTPPDTALFTKEELERAAARPPGKIFVGGWLYRG